MSLPVTRDGNKAFLGSVSKQRSTREKPDLGTWPALSLSPPPWVSPGRSVSVPVPFSPSLPLYLSLHLSPLISNFQACELLQSA